MQARQTLAEAYRLMLEEYVTHDLGDRVDYRTGEILNGRRYITCPHEPDTSALVPAFTPITSVEGLERFFDHLDKRRLILRNDCRRLFDADKGNHHLHGTDIHLSPASYRLLSKLCDRLDYRNAIIAPVASLAASLGFRRPHLYRGLSSLGSLVRVHGSRKGEIKIEVNPAYGFRYMAQDFGLARSASIQDWYQGLLQ